MDVPENNRSKLINDSNRTDECITKISYVGQKAHKNTSSQISCDDYYTVST